MNNEQPPLLAGIGTELGKIIGEAMITLIESKTQALEKRIAELEMRVAELEGKQQGAG